MNKQEIAKLIEGGGAVFGCELGSTRIKATLISPEGVPLASGSYGWENQYVDGVWTYDMSDVRTGMAACFDDLFQDVEKSYGVVPQRLASGGISGMMHGYIALDEGGNLLVPFRTWRNNITGEASEKLTKLFNAPIPQRWSIAHLYQAVLNGEEHLPRIRTLTTLAGYVHWKLTGEHALGVCEASGMFPVDPQTGDFDAVLIKKFDDLVAEKGYPWKLRDLLPKVVAVGGEAGRVTEQGAEWVDPKGRLQAGLPLCPPEGDAGTGMVATNSISPRTGNVSAGTSVFAMVVLEKNLSKVHEEIDILLTPDGDPVGMAHSNNCTSDFDAWVSVFAEACELMGVKAEKGEIIGKLAGRALQGDPDAAGMLAYGYVSGEHVTGFSEGRPLFVRKPDAPFTLGNFFRAHLYTSLCAMRAGLNILTEDEGVSVETIRGHGGFFKTPEVGQRIMAAATKSAVTLMETAGEGGAWGMALLAAYAVREHEQQSLEDFLNATFSDTPTSVVEPDPEDVKGFQSYFERYMRGLPIERSAVENLS